MSFQGHAISWFEIPVFDLARAKAFYEAIFNIEMESLHVSERLHMALFPVTEGNIGGALCWEPQFYRPGHQGSVVYLNANPDLNEVLNRVPAAGGQILLPKRLVSAESGYIALFQDTEGNRVALHADAQVENKTEELREVEEPAPVEDTPLTDTNAETASKAGRPTTLSNILMRLASALGRKDEQPNIALAEEISSQENKEAVALLVAQLEKTDKKRQSDAVKVLSEISSRKPALLAKHSESIIPLLASKNNRLVWGSMTILNHSAELIEEELGNNLEIIINAIGSGSVIAKDHGVAILAKLSHRHAHALEALLKELQSCPDKQLGQYAEKSIPAAKQGNKDLFLEVLSKRVNRLEKETQRRRVLKAMKRIGYQS